MTERSNTDVWKEAGGPAGFVVTCGTMRRVLSQPHSDSTVQIIDGSPLDFLQFHAGG